jgi:hypothetical protein
MPFGVLATSLEKVDVYQLMKEAFSVANLQSFIKETIENRLFSKGTTGSGKKLQTDNSKRQNTKAYSLFTEYLRESKGLPINRVTLKDEGDLYESFKIFLRDDGFVTQFNWENSKYYEDTPKGIYVNFQSSYSNEYDFYNDVESLTNEELDQVALKIYLVFENKLDAIF